MGCCNSIEAHEFEVFSGSEVCGSPPKMAVIIANPMSGGKTGKQKLLFVTKELEKLGIAYKTHVTEYSGHATVIARDLMRQWATAGGPKVDVLLSIGGDGTLHESVNGMLHALVDMQIAAGLEVRKGGKIQGGAAVTLATSEGVAQEASLTGSSTPLVSSAAGPAAVAPANLGNKDVSSIDKRVDAASSSVDIPRLVADAKRLVPPIGIIPCGSGNTVAHTLGWHTPEEGLRRALSGVHRRIDAIAICDATSPPLPGGGATGCEEPTSSPRPGPGPGPGPMGSGDGNAVTGGQRKGVQEKEGADAAAGGQNDESSRPSSIGMIPRPLVFSVNMTGWGLGTAVMRTADGLRCCCGGAAYNCAAYIQVIESPSYGAEMLMPTGSWTEVHPMTGGERDGAEGGLSEQGSEPTHSGTARWTVVERASYIMIQAQTTIHMGEKMAFAPRAQVDDGLMDVVVIHGGSGRLRLIQMMDLAKDNGKHAEPEIAETMYYKTPELLLRPLASAAFSAKMQGVVAPARSPRIVQGPPSAPMMHGENSLNVDGELAATSPALLRCIGGLLPIMVGSCDSRGHLIHPTGSD